ncbi:hypothetical protein LPJ61_006510 [Coemansia biformis]|uniref:Uncharacterized protein n=1 Tax=Coemansia biformis TaxID=1286918 RepID=A0A9W8CM34_9FUNG|nr:hypothetical protein LPJ61_006510 [Coemansia biformis]
MYARNFVSPTSPRNSPRKPQMQTQRGNDLSVEPGCYPYSTSYIGLGQRSHTPPPIGSSQQRGARHVPPARPNEAGSGFVDASARKSRHRSQQKKSNKTPIRSNWFHKAEALSESDLQDQEFLSSNEEDFCDEVRGYAGDMVAQQKLIQKQQRSIFDLNMHCKMLQTAMNSSTKEPYEALLSDFGRTCASNRRANRELEQLRSEREVLREQCAQLEDKDMKILQLQGELESERIISEHWFQRALNLLANTARASPAGPSPTLVSTAGPSPANPSPASLLEIQLTDALGLRPADALKLQQQLELADPLQQQPADALEGSVSQHTEIAELEVEYYDSEQQAKSSNKMQHSLRGALRKCCDRIKQLCHNNSRPRLHKQMAGAAQAKSYNRMHLWSELKAVVH